MGERLVGGHDGRAVPPGTLGAQRVLQCLAERAPRSRDLRLGFSGSDLQRDVELRVLREQPEHVIEHRHAGRDLGLTGAVHVDAGEQPPGFVSVTRPSHPRRSVAQASGAKSGRHRSLERTRHGLAVTLLRLTPQLPVGDDRLPDRLRDGVGAERFEEVLEEFPQLVFCL